MTRIAMIGASGLVGSLFAARVDGHDLVSLARRRTLEDGREKIGPMEEWPAMLANERVDVAVSTIGTTWAKVKDWDAFEAIDRHAVTDFACAAKEAGARQMIVVSSGMADADSRSRYLAIKGRMEEDLRGLGFQRLDIFRPGLLRGSRGKERRLKERLGILISPLVNPIIPSKFRAIDAARVADAMVACVGATETGSFVHHNREILAESGR